MKKHRLFVAVNLPDDVRKRLLDATAEWRDLPIRWTKKENLHVTLVFLGSTGDDEMSRIASVLPLAADQIEPFEIALEKILPGPPKGPPRMIWAEGALSPELAKLQQAVEAVIFEERLGGHVGEIRPFHPHITLGRFEMLDWRRLQEKPRLEKSLRLIVPVSSIELMESELGPKGPSYTILSSADLGG